MRLPDLNCALWIGLGAVCGFGCDRPEPRPEAPETPKESGELAVVQPDQVIARLHWLGKQHIAAQTNAAFLIELWDLPESRRLADQTLDKLSTAPWRLSGGSASNAAAALLRPLLDDLVQTEVYFEMRGDTNHAAEMVLAVHLPEARTGLWESNVMSVIDSLAAGRTELGSDGRTSWSLWWGERMQHLELARAGNWMLFGVARERSPLLEEIAGRIRRDAASFPVPVSDHLLAADLDLARLAPMLSLSAPTANLPRVAFVATGGGESIRSQGTLTFSRPLSPALEPWSIPASIIGGNLACFTAVRGVRPLLGAIRGWNALGAGVPPDQICSWGLNGLAMQTFCAVPVPNASNRVSEIADLILKQQHEWLARELGVFEKSELFNGVEWNGVPYMVPFMQSVTLSNGEFALAGFYPVTEHVPARSELLDKALEHSNLVYYDWEVTGLRLEQWLYMGQFIRLVLNKPQLPNDSSAVAWVTAISRGLNESLTTAHRTGMHAISFERTATLGCTAIELHLLVDWLESPDFPRGLHTRAAAPELPGN